MIDNCVICGANTPVVRHHISYGFLSPEHKVLVCRVCHGQIHAGYHPAYLAHPLETAYYHFDFEEIRKQKRKLKRILGKKNKLNSSLTWRQKLAGKLREVL